MLSLYKNLPTIDLHGETKDISKILVHDFIRDNYKLKNENIVIIHGIGRGIIKKAVEEELKKNRLVKDFKLDNFNSGVTLVKLDL